MRRIALGVVIGATLGFCASAPAQTITVVNDARVPRGQLVRAERAVQYQLNAQLRRYWHTPKIAFGPGGWRLYIKPQWRLTNTYGDADGTHQYKDGMPSILIGWDHDPLNLSDSLSHELIETLVNPKLSNIINSWLVEPADPAVANGYLIDGYMVSDFVTPAWFANGPGPYDQMRRIHAPQTLGPAGYDYKLVNGAWKEIIWGG